MADIAEEQDIGLAQGFTKIASSGPTRFGNMISEEFLPELTWPRAYKAYDEMRRNSATVGGFIRAIESAFKSCRWYTIPYDSTPESMLRAAFLEECIYDMNRSFSDVLTDVLTMLPFGFSALEMVFKFRSGREIQYPLPQSKFSDGKVGFADFSLIPQNTIMEWIYDLPDYPDNLVGIKQMSIMQSPGRVPIVEIPISKVLHFRARAEKDNPEGESILRQAYRSYYFMSNLEVVEAISLERTGAGIPVMKLPQGATSIASAGTASDEANALKIVKQVRMDEQAGIVLPFGWEFDIVSSKGLRPELFDLAIKRHRANILISVLAAFLELGTARVGSFATARIGRSFFEVAFDGWVNGVEETINNKAVPLLFALNGVTDERLPAISHTALGGEDLEAVVTSVEKLIKLGLVEVEPAVKEHFYNLLRLPRGSTILERNRSTFEEEQEEEQDDIADEGALDSQTGVPNPELDDMAAQLSTTNNPGNGYSPNGNGVGVGTAGDY